MYLKCMLFISLVSEKLAPMSCMPRPRVLKTECIVFRYTDQRRLVNNVLYYSIVSRGPLD